jgi:hypothetical protein
VFFFKQTNPRSNLINTQCGDDEEFLRELLNDLKDEVLENYSNIKDAIASKEDVSV